MTKVYCTKKLKDFIGNVGDTLPENHNEIKLSDWNAHLFFVDKRKCLVFVNILTYYCVFVKDVLKKDMKNIDQIFHNRLKEQLFHDLGMSGFNKVNFLVDGSELDFNKTNNNKKVIGRINDFVYTFKTHCRIKYGHLDQMRLVYENGLINETLTGKYTDAKKSWSNPIDNVKEEIKTNTY